MKVQTNALSIVLIMTIIVVDGFVSFNPSDQGERYPVASSLLSTKKNRLEVTKLHGGVMDFLNAGKTAMVKSLAGEYDAVAIQQRINGLIDQNPVLMLSFTTCPYCIKAKQVLNDIGAKYTVVELDTDPEGKAIRAELGDIIGRTSVPAIWINSVFIGGCNDGPLGGIVSLQDSGKLQGMLKSAGAV